MKFLYDNWSFFVLVAIIIFLGIVHVNKFTNLDSNTQLAKVKQWALYIVIQMEKLYGHGTGSLKLSAAYDCFVKAFPSLVTVVSFELFSKIIDEALVEMKHLLETNLDINEYVYGKEGEKQ